MLSEMIKKIDSALEQCKSDVEIIRNNKILFATAFALGMFTFQIILIVYWLLSK